MPYVENSPDRAAWLLCKSAYLAEPKLSLEPSAFEGKMNLVIDCGARLEYEASRWKSTPANAFVSLRHAIHRAMNGDGSVEHVLAFVRAHRAKLSEFAAGPLKVTQI